MPFAPTDTPATRLAEERLARARCALALYTEVFRAGELPGSRLPTLRRGAGLEDLLGLASDDEVGYLLDYQDAYRIQALGFYVARYAYLAAWPVAELAGGPVDLAEVRADFRRPPPRSVGTLDVNRPDAPRVSGPHERLGPLSVGTTRPGPPRRRPPA